MPSCVRIGTSGYHFKDWVGTVYPKGLPATEFLPFYAQMFDCVEVNTSFYRIPRPELFEGMLEKAPEGFIFVVKTPKEMTHERERFGPSLDPFLDSLRPLRDAERLGGLLAQFPYAFKPSPANVAHLERLAKAFVDRGIPISVEFRHDGWCKEQVFDRLREFGLGFVNVDLPKLPHLPSPTALATSPVGYVRLHGRNSEMWWEHPTASHRYDYSYSQTELGDWATRIEELRSHVDVVFAFTNNCRMGASVIDALRMKRLLGLDDLLPQAVTTVDLFEEEPTDALDAMQRRLDEARRLDAPSIERWKAEESSGA